MSYKPGSPLSGFIENVWLNDGDSSPDVHERIFPSDTFALVLNLALKKDIPLVWNCGGIGHEYTMLVLFIVCLGILLFTANPLSKFKEDIMTVRASSNEPPTRRHAEAKIAVQSSEAKPYDQTQSPVLMEVQIDETFTGEIEGKSTVRALQVLHDDKSASLVSVQRFHGELGGRQGTFVLQGSETVEHGKIKAKWFVVPESGTGDLSRLRGEGGFEGEFGKGSEGWLDYWFE